MNKNIQENIDLLFNVTKKLGAKKFSIIGSENTSLSVSARLGKLENVERNESKSIGLRIIDNKKQSTVSTTNLSVEALTQLAETALAMVKYVPEDPFCDLPNEKELYVGNIDLDLEDKYSPNNEELLNKALEAEDSALDINGIKNSEGSSYSHSKSKFYLSSSNGFSNSYIRTNFSAGLSVIAGEGTKMERDYEYQSQIHNEDLDSPKEIGKKAGKRAIARLNPKKVKSSSVPIILDPKVSGSLVSLFSGGISGQSIARGTSFLKDKMNKKLFNKNIEIIDNPLMLRGHRSRIFDSEGVKTNKIYLVKNGELLSWILDSNTSKQLKMKNTGHATGSPPNPAASNIYINAGKIKNTEMIKTLKNGFYITEMMGMSFNQVTGDYSRGATGFWIENGEKIFPVSEVTVAGNIIEMFKTITPASDLKFTTGIDAPTLMIDNMTVAGL